MPEARRYEEHLVSKQSRGKLRVGIARRRERVVLCGA